MRVLARPCRRSRSRAYPALFRPSARVKTTALRPSATVVGNSRSCWRTLLVEQIHLAVSEQASVTSGPIKPRCRCRAWLVNTMGTPRSCRICDRRRDPLASNCVGAVWWYESLESLFSRYDVVPDFEILRLCALVVFLQPYVRSDEDGKICGPASLEFFLATH